jgi:non-canonical poly(A) RNA polymerase PAPD5/7
MAESKDNEGTRTEIMVPDDLTEDFLTLRKVNDDESDKANLQEQQAEKRELAHNSYDPTRDLPPWMDGFVDHHRINHLVALHNEVVGFCKLMEPHKDEMKERENLVDRFTALVKSTFDNCQVDVFGSQATGLCLPSSDIDIAIQLSEDDTPKAKGENGEKSDGQDSKQKQLKDMENWDIPTGGPLHRLAEALRGQWLAELSYLEVIENTRVPLVKFTHAPTKICVDVCFNQKSGPQAAKLMHQYMDAMPPLRPLTFVLKYFMASRGLNQPYTGGVGSFMLQMMIVSFLQQRERDIYNNRRPSVYNLGALLIEFFELYSMDFNFITTGISVRFDGFYFPKGAADRKKNFWQPQRPFSMSMENPFELTADVGTASFRIQTVQRSFEVAMKAVLSHVTEPVTPTGSILASILPPTDEMRKRSTIARLKPLQAPRSSPAEPPRKRQRRK